MVAFNACPATAAILFFSLQFWKFSAAVPVAIDPRRCSRHRFSRYRAAAAGTSGEIALGAPSHFPLGTSLPPPPPTHFISNQLRMNYESAPVNVPAVRCRYHLASCYISIYISIYINFDVSMRFFWKVSRPFPLIESAPAQSNRRK